MSGQDRLALLRGFAVLLLLWVYRLGRCVLAWLLLTRVLGTAAATVLIALMAVLRLSWVVRLTAAAALLLVWHWPWWAALLACAPRLLLMLPGVLTSTLARWRHPRPLWNPPAGPSLGSQELQPTRSE